MNGPYDDKGVRTLTRCMHESNFFLPATFTSVGSSSGAASSAPVDAVSEPRPNLKRKRPGAGSRRHATTLIKAAISGRAVGQHFAVARRKLSRCVLCRHLLDERHSTRWACAGCNFLPLCVSTERNCHLLFHTGSNIG